MKRKSLYRNLGGIISQQRKLNRFSQEQLAFIVGIDRTYLARIEEGKANPSIKVLNKIAMRLDIPIGKLLENV
jgi:transcriptional regulator with XRE-family HTH domain